MGLRSWISESEKMKPAKKKVVRVWSELLQAYLWVVDTDQDSHSLMSQGVSEAICTHDEIDKLKDLSKDSLKAINKVKEAFPESTIEEINKLDNK
ncbi:MAG: hypothetical protein COY75_03920 [Nitrospirae bacterium CG_4_10_14_0_8_um_filter_41_23]|nr:hypothetical protein [Nitrospirota bacterium]PIQ93653.1 MAG: hypothetical protein COV68_08690 [Nitrospirae bacterium CG11_big_fil_rev_8_21_14_0_20_41_14]PIV44342.1 MAG: hypothetical protein COS27_02065 [Nitrospirae bacterium CG02_land_8_20_14_3_00_41_53]PIW87402.1 MAG: hypothetical protein COZ94_05390 [Nitrospirae bacterium CG_4_8_14_3_um_filter_41_47]PIY87218.1 MAG: hypothetical protein COY75_03920 [Nitrospirae bacterium CG_4_10_14_0_8_um_filter_41_23]PJA79542.1 MAG: hypothetical protein C